MSRFLQDVYGADRANQALAVLGGVTAPSYEAVSLYQAAHTLQPDPDVLLPGLVSPKEIPQRAADSESASMREGSNFDVSASQVRTPSVLTGLGDEPGGIEVSQVSEFFQDMDLLTRFQTLDADNGASLSFRTGESRPGSDGASEPVASSSGSTGMSTFLQQLVAKVEGAADDVSTDLNGSTQGAVRELIIEIGSDLSASVRMELQDNVAGVGRELAAQVINRAGIEPLETAAEPLLAVDYYGESAVVINGILDGIGQPIGSIALPQLGPLVADLKSEMAGFSA